MRQSSLAYVASLLVFSIIAMTRPAMAADSELSPLTAVEVVLVGRLANEPSLFGRVKSLFEPGTLLGFETAVELDPNAILRPELPDKLYIWIASRAGERARVYVAIREASVRYLYRDVELESGLDEVGIETLAQIAHSSARALWAHEQQVSRSAVLTALQSELAERPAEVPKPNADSAGKAAASAPEPAPVRDRPVPSSSPARMARLSLGATYAVRSSGAEGWLHEPGAVFSLVLREQFSIRLGAAYVVPHRFDAPLTRIRLDGFSSDLRIGWKTRPIHSFRGLVEAGVGLFFADWSAESRSPAVEQPGQHEQRAFALTSLGVERELGPLTLAARAQLRVPFRATNYEVVGSETYSWKAEAWLSPGFAFDVGIPLD
ncbi:MAG TPA: hypothetical protein VIV60_18670 [Polyangiaceae bacterium]